MAVSPERDFQKVPNSVTRQAMAARLFRGKSKQVWDYLWSVSRGAVVPSRTVRRSRPQIKTAVGFGSMGTVDSAINHLQSVGLIVVKTIVGENGGNEYEVFTPEEVAIGAFGLSDSTGSTKQSGSTKITQNSVLPVVPETGSTGSTLSATSADVSEGSKTFFKTSEPDDDENPLNLLREAERELTGNASSIDQWKPVIELLVAELKVAAARTSITSASAFLAEHLRRRLSKAPAVVTAAPTARVQAASEPAPPAPPTRDELIDTYVNFLHTGMSVDDVDDLLSPSVDPEQWPQIKQAAIKRFEAESKSVRPPGE